MSDLKLEFPQLDQLMDKLESLEIKVVELSKWIKPDSFVHSETVATPPLTAATPNAAPVPTAPTPAAPSGNPAAPVVPVSGTPTYTLDQISRAGASLVDAGKMQQLLGLLSRYGVQAVTQLKPEQYGAFATELRSLGAQI